MDHAKATATLRQLIKEQPQLIERSTTGGMNVQPSRLAFEAALDAGCLYVNVGNAMASRWWKARRNGATKLWKRSPERWEVPVKAGLRSTGRYSDMTSGGYMYITHPDA